MAASLNLADRLALRPALVQRCTAIVANYALYLLGGSPTAEQESWASGAIKNAQLVGDQVSWHVINQPAFLGEINGSDWSGGSSISDATLTGIVETAINQHFIPPAP